MRAAFLTLGCKVNFYETEKMKEQFRARGFDIVEFDKEAEVYIVNTCTVTNIADRKSRQMLHRAKKKNPDSLVVAVGCYAESGGKQLLEDSAIDAVFSNREKAEVAEKIIETFHLHPAEKRGAGEKEPEQASAPETDRTRAYIKIQDGCNQFCTYCMIPYVRGRGVLSSMPEEEVMAQVEHLAGKGVHEVVLTGIHLSSYGVDFSGEKNFVRLGGRPLLEVLEKAAEVEGIERIRLGSLEPRIITEEFLEKMVHIPKVCPHFHLSLQSGCDSVLKRMNRHYTTEEYHSRVELLRQYFDNPAVTTDIIVGFPGETEEEFLQTREYLARLRLADIHVFPYSPRAGTKAADMEGQVPGEVKKARSEILLSDTEKYRLEYGQAFLGRQERVLFEEEAEEGGEQYLIGHNERYVKIGVPLEKAREKNWRENEIHQVTVEKVMKK